MNRENEVPVGSVPVNPLVADNTPEVEAPVEAIEAPAAADPSEVDKRIATLEKMLADSQGMIGKQSGEVGSLRQQLSSLQQANQPQEPSLEDQIDEISAKMEEGDIGLREGNKLIAKLSAKMGADSAFQLIGEKQNQEKVSAIHGKFLADNPDFEELRDNGTLQSIIDQDPMADLYSAYQMVKAQRDRETLTATYEQEKAAIAAKIPQAKEEGAKLAQGASEAGKVLGKNGTAARAAAESVKPFKTKQDAHDAMMKTLQQMRS